MSDNCPGCGWVAHDIRYHDYDCCQGCGSPEHFTSDCTEVPSVGACWDCGRRYGDTYGFPDLVIPDDIWKLISPTGDEGGLLCPSCICYRLQKAKVRTTGKFTSGPLS